MALPHNEAGVRTILATLEPRILGRALKGWSCCCGSVRGDDATATQINVPGDLYPGQETRWAIWNVTMTPVDPGDVGWACGLSEFVSADELRALFAEHFTEAD